MNRINAALVCLLLIINTSIDRSIANSRTAVLAVSVQVLESCTTDSKISGVREYNSATGAYDTITNVMMKCNNGTSYVIKALERAGTANKPSSSDTKKSTLDNTLQRTNHLAARSILASALSSAQNQTPSNFLSNDLSRAPTEEHSAIETSSANDTTSEEVQDSGSGSQQPHLLHSRAAATQANTRSERVDSTVQIVIEY